ncbi:MAG: hypothetical protein ACP5MT_00160 [Candidatus Acidifodinimicrobium sp.]
MKSIENILDRRTYLTEADRSKLEDEVLSKFKKVVFEPHWCRRARERLFSKEYALHALTHENPTNVLEYPKRGDGTKKYILRYNEPVDGYVSTVNLVISYNPRKAEIDMITIFEDDPPRFYRP